MASWTTPPVHAVGDYISLTDWNNVANNETFLFQRPYGLYWGNDTSTVNHGHGHSITLSSATSYSSGNYGGQAYGFTQSGINITVPYDGLYQVSFAAALTGTTSAGVIWADLTCSTGQTINGDSTETANGIGGNIFTSTGSGLLLCTANSTLTLQVQNGSGNNLQVVNQSQYTFVNVMWMGSL
jgi:hypothetical protein